jgi:hypothetical protein
VRAWKKPQNFSMIPKTLIYPLYTSKTFKNAFLEDTEKIDSFYHSYHHSDAESTNLEKV